MGTVVSGLHGEMQRVSSMRAELNRLDAKLRELQQRKRSAGAALGDQVRALRQARAERDELTLLVKQHKGERSLAQEALKQQLQRLREKREQRRAALGRLGLRKSPAQAEQQIRRIELRIETEGMPFDAEQKLMKQLKVLKKQKEEAHVIEQIDTEIEALREAVAVLRRKAEEAHQHVQEKAAAGQEKHERLTALAHELNALRKGEKRIRAEMGPLKEQAASVEGQLEGELLKLQAAGREIAAVRSAKQHEQRARQSELLEQKTKLVEEKLRKGQKLTTADLLAWQAKEGDG